MKRSQSIDVLRAIAVLLVLGRHMIPMPASDSWLRSMAGAATHVWLRGGWVGVDLFFVLSGFLVAGLLFREHQKFGCINATGFLIRRSFKIYPAYYVFLAVSAAVVLVQGRFSFIRFVVQSLFLQNYLPHVWPHTWSLAVEEHFYFLLVLVLVWLSSRKSANPFRAIPVLFAVVAISCLVMRVLVPVPRFEDPTTAVFARMAPTHLRLDALFCGVVIAYFYHYHTTTFTSLAQRTRWLAAVLGVAALVPAFVWPLETSDFLVTYGLTLMYVGSALVLVAALTIQPGQSFIVRYLAYVGSHSYSIYLWHPAVVAGLLPFIRVALGPRWTWGLYFTLYLAGAILVGILMSLAIEFPCLKLRDRWFPSRATPLAASPVQREVAVESASASMASTAS